MSRSDKEALLYAKEKVDKAQGFIEAIKQRRHTLIVTMKAIIDIQRQFFLDGDEADLKPMILKDVADTHGTGHQYHLESEQREVCPDQMGHLPAEVLLHRQLHY